jgi:hypothetical protein
MLKRQYSIYCYLISFYTTKFLYSSRKEKSWLSDSPQSDTDVLQLLNPNYNIPFSFLWLSKEKVSKIHS